MNLKDTQPGVGDVGAACANCGFEVMSMLGLVAPRSIEQGWEEQGLGGRAGENHPASRACVPLADDSTPL